MFIMFNCVTRQCRLYSKRGGHAIDSTATLHGKLVRDNYHVMSTKVQWISKGRVNDGLEQKTI